MLKKSCCCYSLEYGAVVIGITFFIINSVGFLMQVALLAEWEDVKDSISDPGPIRHATLTYLIVMAVLSFFYVIFSILLLHGIKGDKRIYFIPWLIWSISYMLVTATFTVHKLVAKIIIGCTSTCLIHVTLGPLLYILFLFAWFYCFICVLEYWKTMKEAPPIPLKHVKEAYVSPNILGDFSNVDQDEEDSSKIRNSESEAFSVQHKKGVEGSDKKSKTRLITSLRRNASTRRVVYPDLVWQRSRDNLLGTDKSAVIYSNVLPFNSAMKSNENQVDGERHYQNLLPGTIV